MTLSEKAVLTAAKLTTKNIKSPIQFCYCYGFLGLCDTNRINAICITLPKVSKASTAMIAAAYVLLQQNLPYVTTADIKKLKMSKITIFFLLSYIKLL